MLTVRYRLFSVPISSGFPVWRAVSADSNCIGRTFPMSVATVFAASCTDWPGRRRRWGDWHSSVMPLWAAHNL